MTVIDERKAGPELRTLVAARPWLNRSVKSRQ